MLAVEIHSASSMGGAEVRLSTRCFWQRPCSKILSRHRFRLINQSFWKLCPVAQPSNTALYQLTYTISVCAASTVGPSSAWTYFATKQPSTLVPQILRGKSKPINFTSIKVVWKPIIDNLTKNGVTYSVRWVLRLHCGLLQATFS